MCFRLLAAVKGMPPSSLELTATRVGLDVRAADRGTGRFVELAWGDCACSLYTRKEGKDRAVAFVEALLRGGCEVQLLLARDDEPLALEGPVERIALEHFRAEGLPRLPEGKVVALVIG